MGELQELLIRLRDNRSYRVVAKMANISHGYLRTLEKGINPVTGKVIMPSAETLKSLAMAYDYSYEKLLEAAGYLDDGSNMKCSVISENVMRIPICSDIINGQDIIVDYGYITRKVAGDSSVLFLKIKDDGMINLRMGKGDIALVRRQNHVEEDDIGVFEISGNGTLIRKVKLEGDDIILVPSNQVYPEQRYHKSDVTIIGVVEISIVHHVT